MKKSGFTLIELLAVIIILGIIALITVISVNSTITDTKKSLSETQIKNVEEAAKSYYLQEGMNIDDDCVSVSELIEKGYVEGNTVLDPKTKEEMTGYVKITHTSNQYSYEYQTDSCIIYIAVTEETKTTGIVPVQDKSGNIVPGSEFKIKVNDTSDYLTFFVLSNDGDYVNLIAQKNLASNGTFVGENQTVDGWSSISGNGYGPQNAYEYLSNVTSTWTNIPIIENFSYVDEGYLMYGYKGIENSLDQMTGNYIATITPFSSDFGDLVTYENMRARLPMYNEILENTSCTITAGSCDDESLWIADYLKTSDYVTGGTSTAGYSWGYWTLSSYKNHKYHVNVIHYNGNTYHVDANNDFYGIRPVITVLKKDLLREM